MHRIGSDGALMAEERPGTGTSKKNTQSAPSSSPIRPVAA